MEKLLCQLTNNISQKVQSQLVLRLDQFQPDGATVLESNSLARRSTYFGQKFGKKSTFLFDVYYDKKMLFWDRTFRKMYKKMK